MSKSKLMDANPTEIPYERLMEIAKSLLEGLLTDGEEEGYKYMANIVGITAEEAEILLSDSGDFRKEDYEEYL